MTKDKKYIKILKNQWKNINGERNVNVFKKVLLASVATAAVAAVSAPAMAEEGLMGGELSANVAFVSDYRFRGVSFSGEDFAIQGGLDWGHESGFRNGFSNAS